MSWILLAVIGHLMNAVAFVVDKMLLASVWKKSGTYAVLIGGLSGLVLLVGPWVRLWPHGFALVTSFLFGGVFVLGMWAFFESLRRAEASRVLPIIGSFVPIFTLFGTTFWLDEKISLRMGIGFLCLLFATWMLARGSRHTRLDRDTISIALLSAFLFAIASVAGKDAFERSNFAGVFIFSRGAAAFVAIMIAVCVPDVKAELLHVFSQKQTPRTPKQHASLVWTILAQASGAIGFILVNAAIALGSAPLVNALQAVQYAAIVLVAWIGGSRLRHLLKEEVTPRILVSKACAIVLIGFGLCLITLPLYVR